MSKRAKGPSITDPEYSWVPGDVDKHFFVFDTRDKLDQFVSVYPVCEDSVFDYTVAKPCRARERVYMKPRVDSYDFCYVYEFMFKEYFMTFPLIDFEAGMLSLMNIAPSQLHPNIWAFLTCFELVYNHLGFEPSLNVFTYFYQMKIGKLVGWVSLTASHGTPLFSLYNSSYKFLKTKFFKLCCHPEDMEKRLFFTPIILLGSRCIGRNQLGFCLVPTTALPLRRKTLLMQSDSFVVLSILGRFSVFPMSKTLTPCL